MGHTLILCSEFWCNRHTSPGWMTPDIFKPPKKPFVNLQASHLSFLGAKKWRSHFSGYPASHASSGKGDGQYFVWSTVEVDRDTSLNQQLNCEMFLQKAQRHNHNNNNNNNNNNHVCHHCSINLILFVGSLVILELKASLHWCYQCSEKCQGPIRPLRKWWKWKLLWEKVHLPFLKLTVHEVEGKTTPKSGKDSGKTLAHCGWWS